MALGTRRKGILAAGAAVVAGLSLALGLVITTRPAGTRAAGAGPADAPSATTAPGATAPAALSGDAATGFWYGSDSSQVAVSGPVPYHEPAIGGAYGGYFGMIGNWAAWLGCGDKVVWSPTDAKHARTNHVTYHLGVGVGGYWFMAGPGVDPHYNGSTTEAYVFGERQALAVLNELPHESSPVNYPVIFMDIELPGNAPGYTPAPDNGW